MPPALRPAAPSRSLLRYLRAQSEGLPFAPTCRAAVERHPALQRRHVCTAGGSTKLLPRQPSSTTTTRSLSTITPPKRTELRVGLVDLEAILPKSLRKQRTTKSLLALPPPAGSLRFSSNKSSDCDPCPKRPSVKEWLFGNGEKTGAPRPNDDDIRVALEEESGSIFQRRALTAKAAMDPRLRCTEVDENGNVVMVDGELKKSELIAKVRGLIHMAGNDWQQKRMALLTSKITVRSSAARSSQDRFVQPSAYPHPSFGDSPQPATLEGPDQA